MVLSAAMARIKLFLALACFYWPLALADVPAQVEATDLDIRTLLHLNGSEDSASQLGRVIGEGVTTELHRTIPNLPARADTVVLNTVETYLREQASHGSMTDLLVPIYARYLTKSDVEELIAFYKSPLGKKLAAVTPGISFESSRVGQQWAASIAPGLQLKLREALQREKLIQ
jgi:hypothetical protein